MRCKDIERLIIDSPEEDQNLEKLNAMEKHVAQCSHCVRFQNDLKKIRITIKTVPAPVPSPDLLQKTRVKCHTEIHLKHSTEGRASPTIASTPLPVFIWAVLLSLILLTVIIIVPVLKDIRLNQPLSLSSAAVLTLIIQNFVMLFFAPILIRKHREIKQQFRSMELNANAS